MSGQGLPTGVTGGGGIGSGEVGIVDRLAVYMVGDKC